jgi:uncharacterized membrane protein (DUF2068 family)
MAKAQATVRLIAVFKLIKAVALLLVAAGAFGLVQLPLLDRATTFIRELPLQTGHGFLVRAMERVLRLQPHQLVLVGGVALLYAAVFAVEGIGLWKRKRWAEILTIVVTASLIPFEIWEIVHRVTALKIAGLAVNVAIVIYLCLSVARRGSPTLDG